MLFVTFSHAVTHYVVAINGHTECLRLLMETADDSNIVDVGDSLDRFVYLVD